MRTSIVCNPHNTAHDKYRSTIGIVIVNSLKVVYFYHEGYRHHFDPPEPMLIEMTEYDVEPPPRLPMMLATEQENDGRL